MTFKRKILRKIFRLVIEDSQRWITTNAELEKLYKDINIGTFIKLHHLRWRGHLERMDNVRNAKKIYQANVHKKMT
jgi:hypothetical protein